MTRKDDAAFGATSFGTKSPLSVSFRTASEKYDGTKKPTMK
jgi:hypothetical protein